MSTTSTFFDQNQALAALIRRVAFEAPQLTDLQPDELERLAQAVVLTNLGNDLRRLAALAKIDYEAEVMTYLATASRSGSWKTITAYTHGLARLDEWAYRRGLDVLDLSPRQADEYIYYLRNLGRSPASIRLDVAAPSAFFSFLERRFDVIRNPFRGSRAKPTMKPTREIVIPSKDEFSILCEHAFPWLRAAILCMGLRGLRVGALPTLIFHEEKFIGHSKGKDIHGVMPTAALAAIRDAGLDDGRPFRGVSSRNLAELVRRHSNKLCQKGIVRAVYSAHDYRHYFAVQDYRANSDIYRLRRLLGHSQIGTTERYLESLRIL